MASAPERLSPASRSLLEDRSHELPFSVVSAWEIAIKQAIGKLRLEEPAETFVPSRVTALRTSSLPIEQRHALRVAVLPTHHRDPFDRLLIAQAQVEDLPILTADAVFRRYEIMVIEA